MRRTVEAGFNELRNAARPWWIRLCLVIVALLAGGVLGGYRVNVSRSLPLGLYRVIGNKTAVERGSIVIVCLPEAWSRFAVQRQILGPGHCTGGSYGLGKIVVAVEGDIVTLSRNRLTVNGVPLPNGRTVARDALGGPMPHYPWATYILASGSIWLYACHSLAFDSRYFGPVRAASVESVIAPVVTRPAGCRDSAPAYYSEK